MATTLPSGAVPDDEVSWDQAAALELRPRHAQTVREREQRSLSLDLVAGRPTEGTLMMYYQIRPHGPLFWVDVPDSVIDLAISRGTDLADLDWKPSEEMQPDQNKVRVALRYGAPCSTGIVVADEMFRRMQRGDEIRALGMESSEAHAALAPQRQVVEQLLPGSKEWREANDREIEELTNRIAASHDEKARALLARKAPLEHLAAHWRTIGGTLPDPL